MKKWEQQKNRTTHHKKISNVKSVLNATMKTNNSEKSKQRKNNDTDKKTTKIVLPKLQICPLYNLLKNFQLQQYTNAFIELGYGYDLTKFRKINQKKRDQIMLKLKLQPEHRMKVQTLINYISILMNNIFEVQLPSSKGSQYRLPKINQKKTMTKNFVQLNKKSVTIKKKSKSRPPLPKKYQDSPFSNQSVSKVSKISAFTYQRKSLFRFSHHDDISITHKIVNGKQKTIFQQNRIMTNLRKKLQRIDNQKGENIDLHMSKIKQMYLSFDSATLTSNIINLDLEQLCFCFSSEILNLVKILKQKYRSDYTKSIKQKSHSNFTKSELQSTTSMIPVLSKIQTPPRNNKTDREDHKNFQITKFTPIKEASVRQKKLHIIQQKMQEGFQSILEQKKQVIQSILKQSFICIQNKDSQQSNHARIKTSSESSAFQSTFQQQSIQQNCSQQQLKIRKFRQFNIKCNQPLFLQPPTLEVILNYVKNIIITAKMEKQVPIIAYIYINKLLQCSGQFLTQINWRNIVFICLVVGSKIWDDTSLQNHTIAQVITTHTTIQLNHLQKTFLWFIDYGLTIDQKQYSGSYFKLRNHIKDSKKSVSLRPLNLQAIRKLQQQTSKLQYKLKQKYKKLMNKSF